MAIKSISEMKNRKPEIDLTGPQGNAFCLLGYAAQLADQLGKDKEAIRNEMKLGDYENLVSVFDREFGEYVTLYR